MGFYKRFVTEDYIKTCQGRGMSLKQIFNADALIFADDYSYNLYKKYLNDEDVH